MPQIDANQLKQAEVSTTLAKDMITKAIEQSAANPTLAEEAIKQASNEISQVQAIISQVQSSFQSQRPQGNQQNQQKK